MVITYSIKPNVYGGLMCEKLNIPFYANVQGLGTAFQKPGLAQFATVLYKSRTDRKNLRKLKIRLMQMNLLTERLFLSRKKLF